VDGGSRDRRTALSETKTDRLPPFCEALQRVVAGCIFLIEATDQGRDFWIRFDGAFAVAPLHIAVPERSERWPHSLLSFFEHSFPGFFGKIVDVLLSHQNFDPVHKLFGRLRSW
jgi:hypothetical protein